MEHERQRTKNVQEERDESVKVLASALNESEGVKSENKVLKQQIMNLKRQFDENLKPVKVTARERVKERVESERRRGSVYNTKRVDHEPERVSEKTFIDVFIQEFWKKLTKA